MFGMRALWFVLFRAGCQQQWPFSPVPRCSACVRSAHHHPIFSDMATFIDNQTERDTLFVLGSKGNAILRTKGVPIMRTKGY
jgi:hypothetical protein|tara:strand:- start:2587 stop:2832 length:246 start_codon:yes stop_codon:yes gene_type:complete